MKKQILSLSVVACVVLSGMTAANAAASSGHSAHIDLNGTISDITCNVDVSQNTLGLGSATPETFTAVTAANEPGLESLNSLYASPASKRMFNAKLSGCTGATPGDTKHIDMTVNGITIPSNNNIFNDDTTNTESGFLLARGDTDKSTMTTPVVAGQSFTVKTYGASDTAGAADNSTIYFTAYMASIKSSPAVANLKAGLDIGVDYQ